MVKVARSGWTCSYSVAVGGTKGGLRSTEHCILYVQYSHLVPAFTRSYVHNLMIMDRDIAQFESA